MMNDDEFDRVMAPIYKLVRNVVRRKRERLERARLDTSVDRKWLRREFEQLEKEEETLAQYR